MSPPDKRNAREGNPGAAISATTKQQDRQQDSGASATVAVRAVAAYGPCRGRTMWTYPVHCGRCGGTHLHRAGPPREDGYLRTAPCGAVYVVVARTVLPALEVVA